MYGLLIFRSDYYKCFLKVSLSIVSLPSQKISKLLPIYKSDHVSHLGTRFLLTFYFAQSTNSLRWNVGSYEICLPNQTSPTSPKTLSSSTANRIQIPKYIMYCSLFPNDLSSPTLWNAIKFIFIVKTYYFIFY